MFARRRARERGKGGRKKRRKREREREWAREGGRRTSLATLATNPRRVRRGINWVEL